MIAMRYLIPGILACVTAAAAPVHFQSSERQEALVELYTSEGCSSCPPAESWLSGLKAKTGLWSEFVPVAFHVDYWNNLGWTDKWSSRQNSERQRNYAAVWGSDTIYTPEFVVNGKEWHNWFELKGAPGLSDVKAGILDVTSEDSRHWRAHFNPTTTGSVAYEVNAAMLICELGSDVTAGENSGRHLKHDFAVIKLINQPLAQEDGGYRGDFTVTYGKNTTEGKLALAVWVTPAGRLEPVQAVGGWLVPHGKMN
jgi:hypothetical protein